MMAVLFALLLSAAAFAQEPVRDPGEFEVPANRTSASSGSLTLRYVRIRSNAAEPRAPIVFLAGGPGDSGIRVVSGMPKPVLNELLSIADVIAFDQRGTGTSDPAKPLCPPGHILPRDQPFDPRGILDVLRDRLTACLTDARARGIDVRGLTTEESADDLASLAQALGVKKLTLLAGSYGTHLALVTARRHPDLIDRLALAGIEGPDDTLKLPSRVDEVLKAVAGSKRSTLVDDVRTLRTRLAAGPVRYTFPTGQTILLGEWDLQRWISDSLDTGRELDQLVTAIPSLLNQDYGPLGRWALAYRSPRPINLMNVAMDCASHASPDRLARIAGEAKAALLGDAINYPLPGLCDVPGLPRLPGDYREAIRSSVPILLISGTLDGRTPVANAVEVARTLPHARSVIIDGASHDLFRHPETMAEITAFLRQ